MDIAYLWGTAWHFYLSWCSLDYLMFGENNHHYYKCFFYTTPSCVVFFLLTFNSMYALPIDTASPSLRVCVFPHSPESLNFRSGCPVSVRKLIESLFSWYSPPGRPLHRAFPSWLYTQDFYPFLFLNFFLDASLFSYFAYLFMYIV